MHDNGMSTLNNEYPCPLAYYQHQIMQGETEAARDQEALM